MKRSGWRQRVLGGCSNGRRLCRLEVRRLEDRCLPATFAVPPSLWPIAQMISGGADLWYDRTGGTAVGHVSFYGDVAEFNSPAGTPRDLETDLYGNLWFATDAPSGGTTLNRLTIDGDQR